MYNLKILTIITLLILSTKVYAQPKVIRTLGRFGEVCEWVGTERECTFLGYSMDKKATFVIFSNKVEYYSDSAKPMTFAIKGIVVDKPNILSYELEWVDKEKYLLNLPTDDKKIMMLANSEYSIYYFIKDN